MLNVQRHLKENAVREYNLRSSVIYRRVLVAFFFPSDIIISNGEQGLDISGNVSQVERVRPTYSNPDKL